MINKQINTFIQQKCVKIIESDMQNITKDCSSENPENMYFGFHKNIKLSASQHIDFWFLKDHVTLKALPSQE